MTKTVAPSLVLPKRAAASGEPQTFGVFPGRYTPGVPVPLTEVGVDQATAQAEISRLGLPLELVGAEASAEEKPRPRAQAGKPVTDPEGQTGGVDR